MPHAPDADLVRINIHLPTSERDAFDNWCRLSGKPRLSMTAAARELFRLCAAGQVPIDRDGALKASRNVGRPPKPTAKRHSPRPPKG